jgi:pimeloyl-ACP methyl ester carboxylesterase
MPMISAVSAVPQTPASGRGAERLVRDVALVIALLREAHPDVPVYLVGKSMGGAVAMLAVTGEAPPAVDGTVYIAPAVWGRNTMPWYQRLGLWIMLRIRPGMYLSGDSAHDLGIRPTDDPEVSRAMSLDPLVQKRARIDTMHGLTSLMGDALEASAAMPGPAFILYGDNDQIIPPRPVCAMLERLPGSGRGLAHGPLPGRLPHADPLHRGRRHPRGRGRLASGSSGELPSGTRWTRAGPGRICPGEPPAAAECRLSVAGRRQARRAPRRWLPAPG